MEYKYSTINEVNHFEFGEAVVGDIQLTERMFHLVRIIRMSRLQEFSGQIFTLSSTR